MIGIVYAEDYQAGRSPSAVALDTSPLKMSPKLIKISESIQSIGRLCIRHPLPAVLFSESAPENSFIQVEDTLTALGYHFPLFMFIHECQQIDDRLFVSNGIFKIPTPDVSRGHLWDGIIQNSTRFIDKLDLVSATELKIEVSW